MNLPLYTQDVYKFLPLKCLRYIRTSLREKCPKYGVFSGPYFPVFSPNAGNYGPEKTPYLDNFHAVHVGRTNAGCRDVFV